MVSAQREEGDLSRLGSDTLEEENSKVYVTLVYLANSQLKLLGQVLENICLNNLCEQYT